MCQNCYRDRLTNGFTTTYTSISDYEVLTSINITNKVKSIEKNKNMMNLKGLMSRLLDADTQALYKAEYINGDLALTDKGKNKMMELLFVANKKELVELAKAELAEAEKVK